MMTMAYKIQLAFKLFVQIYFCLDHIPKNISQAEISVHMIMVYFENGAKVHNNLITERVLFF